jgi:hypothetical protein
MPRQGAVRAAGPPVSVTCGYIAARRLCQPGSVPQRNSSTGILQERIISVVVEPMISERMRE